jgi:hypothetical protein
MEGKEKLTEAEILRRIFSAESAGNISPLVKIVSHGFHRFSQINSSPVAKYIFHDEVRKKIRENLCNQWQKNVAKQLFVLGEK